jgi:hypothetical protein
MREIIYQKMAENIAGSPPAQLPDLPPGDTLILIVGAVVLVLIVLVGVLWRGRK